jgi:hypothetical protein
LYSLQVHYQRRKYAEKKALLQGAPAPPGIMTDEEEARLNEIGFVWVGHNKKTWEDHYDMLKEWVAEHGHCKIPKVYPQNQPLASFVHTNRRYRMWQLEGKERAKVAWRRLAQERIQLLDDIGFLWDTNGQSLIAKQKGPSSSATPNNNIEIIRGAISDVVNQTLKVEEGDGIHSKDEETDKNMGNLSQPQSLQEEQEHAGHNGNNDQHYERNMSQAPYDPIDYSYDQGHDDGIHIINMPHAPYAGVADTSYGDPAQDPHYGEQQNASYADPQHDPQHDPHYQNPNDVGYQGPVWEG